MALYFASFAVMMREVMVSEANGTASAEPPAFFFEMFAMCGLFVLLVILATFSPLSLGWRRLQDASFPGAGKS